MIRCDRGTKVVGPQVAADCVGPGDNGLIVAEEDRGANSSSTNGKVLEDVKSNHKASLASTFC